MMGEDSMPATIHIYKVKPGITARGFKVAIKEYNEPSVVEVYVVREKSLFPLLRRIRKSR